MMRTSAKFLVRCAGYALASPMLLCLFVVVVFDWAFDDKDNTFMQHWRKYG